MFMRPEGVISCARTQVARARRTANQLVSAARERFAADRYDATVVDAVG